MSQSLSLSSGSSAHIRPCSTPPPIMSLSSSKISQMMLKPDVPVLLSATFHDKPVITMALRHYHFLTVTIERLEKEIERQTIEQQSTFGKLIRR